MEYYAKGPWSNYIDRQRGSLLGLYKTTVDGMFEEQSAPQTMGDRQGLRQLTLDNNSTKLQITTEGMVAFSLSHFDDAQFNYDVFSGGSTEWRRIYFYLYCDVFCRNYPDYDG